MRKEPVMRCLTLALAFAAILGCAGESTDATEAAATPAATPANRPPELGPITSRVETNMEYDNQGALSGVKTTVFLETTATDPDGDPLRWDWSATSGNLEASGNQATWSGMKIDDEVTLTVDDGKGGTRTHKWIYAKEEGEGDT
jgi:hypothetical protein